MADPDRIDLDSWMRRTAFEYTARVPCTYAVTVEIDRTELVAALRRTWRNTFAEAVRTVDPHDIRSG